VNSVLVGPTASEGVGTFVADLAKQQGISSAEFEQKFFRERATEFAVETF